MHKDEIARVLEEIATLLELKGENPFRVRAYRNGARALLMIEEDLETIIKQKKLTEIEGIGDHIAEKITELFETGKLPYYERLKKATPNGLLDLMQVPGLGPKKVKTLYQKLKIKSVEELKRAAEKGRISKLEGFGEKTEQNILQSLANLEIYQQRTLWWSAAQIADTFLGEMKKLKEVEQAEICGSIRRKLETVGDLDFLVASDEPKPIMDWFISKGSQILAQGLTKSSIRFASGMQADLRIVPSNQFVYALVYSTGSKEHTIKIRTRALKKGWSLNEYGFEALKKNGGIPRIKDEEGFYKSLGLSYIPPELREDAGEIEAAEKGKIPILIEERDIRGSFHNHTTASDGRNRLKEMIEAAEELGWEYIGISDHSKSSAFANGLSEERLMDQIEAIQQINGSKKYKVRVFAGTECDILADGSLDFENEILKKLDFVIASIHAPLNQDEKTMTNRIIKALENPYTTILGHATGRLLLQREPYPVNMAKVIDAAIANNKIIELNGNPRRLDMDWRLWRQAAKKGLRCCINCDAHGTDQLQFIRSGVNAARKGWLTKKDVINTLSLKQLIKFLQN